MFYIFKIILMQENTVPNMPMFDTQIPPMPNVWFDQQFSNLWKDNLNNNLNIEPNNLSWWQLIWKVLLGFVVGAVISGLLLVVLTFVGTIFTDAVQQQSNNVSNPLLPLLLLFIWFLGSFIGNMIVAWAYSLFFSKKYYNSSKMFAFLLLTNGILFFVLAPIYLVFSKDVNTLFIVLAFHILFSIFVSASQLEFLSNPNYSGSAIIWNTLWFTWAIFVYMMIYKLSKVSWSVQQQTYLLMLLPSILGFTFLPLGSGLWEKIYYKVYEMGSNVFYIPSLSEVASSESEEQDIKEQNDEIHVNMG